MQDDDPLSAVEPAGADVTGQVGHRPHQPGPGARPAQGGAAGARRQPERDSPARGGRGAHGDPLARLLIAGEVAFALMVVVAAGLLSKEFRRIATRDIGYDPHRLVLVGIHFNEYPTYRAQSQSRSPRVHLAYLEPI